MTNFRRSRRRLTIEECISRAIHYDRKYLDVTVHSIDLYDPQKKSELVHEFLSRENRGAFKATNPHSSRLLMAELLDAFANNLPKAGRDDEEMAPCALVTITHEAWTCADSNIDFDLRAAKKKARAALAATNYIACFEPGHYVNCYYRDLGSSYYGSADGRLVSFHCHAIVWASSRYKLDQLRKRLQRRFRPIPGNRSYINVSRLRTQEDAGRAVVYMSKAPYLGYTKTVKEGGATGQKTTARIPHKARMRLFNEMSKYKTFDLWLAGGHGVAPLRDARNRLIAQYQPKAMRFGGARPSIHKVGRSSV